MFTSLFNSVTSRRNLFQLSIALGATGSFQPTTAQQTTKDNGLDFSIPEDNLYAFGKLWGSYNSKPTYGGYQGVQFARIGTKRLIPLFGYAGFGNMQSRLNSDGSVNIRGTEAGYFTDLKTGQIIDSWDNPWTN